MAATDASRPAPPLPSGANDLPGSIFIRFLKFGCLAWDGPAAQIAMIKEECVDREGWIDETTFKKQLAVYQVLPRPRGA
jgi:chromate transporter